MEEAENGVRDLSPSPMKFPSPEQTKNMPTKSSRCMEHIIIIILQLSSEHDQVSGFFLFFNCLGLV
jgi:hypothetical protein